MQQYKWASCVFYTEHELMSLWMSWSGGNQQQDEEYSSPFQLPKPYVGTLESFQIVPPLPQEHFSEKTGFQ